MLLTSVAPHCGPPKLRIADDVGSEGLFDGAELLSWSLITPTSCTSSSCSVPSTDCKAAHTTYMQDDVVAVRSTHAHVLPIVVLHPNSIVNHL